MGTRTICVDMGTNRILASKEIYTGNPKLPLDFFGPCQVNRFFLGQNHLLSLTWTVMASGPQISHEFRRIPFTSVYYIHLPGHPRGISVFSRMDLPRFVSHLPFPTPPGRFLSCRKQPTVRTAARGRGQSRLFDTPS